MPEKHETTGPSHLDPNLEALLKVLQGDGIENIQKEFGNKTPSLERFKEILPDGQFHYAGALVNPINFEFLLAEQADPEAKKVLKKAKKLTEQKLLGFLKHPLAFERFKEAARARPTQADSPPPLPLAINAISSVSRMLTWFQGKQRLTPGVRVGFSDSSNNRLLDSTLQIQELSFLIATLVQVLSEVLEGSEDLAKLRQIDIGDTAKLATHLGSIERHLANAKRLAPIYGIDLATPESSDSAEAPSSGD